MTLHTIEVTAEDQHAMIRALPLALLRLRSWKVAAGCFAAILVFSVLYAALAITRVVSGESIGSYLGMSFVVVLCAGIVLWSGARSVRTAMPLGSTVRFEVTDVTLNVASANGISMWHWAQIRDAAQIGGALMLRVTTTNGIIMVPRRLMTDDDVRIILSRVRRR